MENAFHVMKGSPFTLAQLQTLRGVLDTYDSTSLKTRRMAAAVLSRIRTKALDTATSPTEDFTVSPPRAGTYATGVAMPVNVSFCSKLLTGAAGRSARGRWYWCNFSSSLLSDASHISAAEASNFVSNLNGLIAALTAAGFTMCVTSFRTGGAWRTTADSRAVTTVAYTSNRLATQRRRLPR